MNQNNSQIIKYEPVIINNNFKIYLPPREICSKCKQVHYYNTDKEICELSTNFGFLNISK